jgi:hypothetical protein
MLKRKLAERDKLTLTAKVATPVILVPASRVKRDSPCLAFSLGTLDVTGGQIEASDETDSTRTWRPVEKTFASDGQEITEYRTDVLITEEAKLRVNGMQVMLLPEAVDDWAGALELEDDKHRLLKRVDFTLTAHVGTEPVQRLVVEAELGAFSVAISRSQVNHLVMIKNALGTRLTDGNDVSTHAIRRCDF